MKIALPGLAALAFLLLPVTVAGDAGISNEARGDWRLEERYLSEPRPTEDLDSVAFWRGNEGRAWLVVTGKQTHRLLVFDATTGRLERTVGREGTGPGEFRRPNGVAVIGNLLLVVERDNRRLQVLSLPRFRVLGFVGLEDLRRPYGLAAHRRDDGALDVWITDSSADTDSRLLRYRLEIHAGAVESRLLGVHGESGSEGSLRSAESVAVDPAADRVLVAEEDPSHRGIKVFTMDGRFTGSVIGEGLFLHDPEGIALYTCGDHGVWVAAEQHPDRTRFHLFDRGDFHHLGSFTGSATANTDGLAVASRPLEGFPRGALFAVDDDSAVGAFDWGLLEKVLPTTFCGLDEGAR